MIVRSERPDIFTKPQHNLGPGSYDASIPTFKPKSGMAPFSSTCERRTGELPLNTPGPGAYAPPSSSLKVASNRPSPQFASTSERMMGERSRARMMDLPGPGSYTGDIVKEPPTRNLTVSGSFHKAKGINWIKVATAPSIPTVGQNHGYEEGNGGQLVQQVVPIAHTGVGMDVPGPGSYNPSPEAVKSHGKLHLSFGKPSVKKPLENGVPGPGSYDLVAPRVPDRPTSMFASTTGRSKLAPDSYGPGPGAFRVKSAFPSLVEHLAANPDTYSAFGSSSTNPRYEPRRDEIPGPGSYLSGGVNQPRAVAKGGATSCFNSGAVRFGETPSSVPGPGAYSEGGKVGFVDKIKQKRGGRFGVFGTTSPRLPREVVKVVPPVGTYETNKPEVNPADLRRKDLRSSAFRSLAPKSPAIVPSSVAKVNAERPLTYDGKIDWPKPYNNSKVFVTSVPRFTSDRRDEEVPGPGSYDTDNFKPSAPEKKATSFGKGHRFESVGFENTPGPGSYYTPQSLNKKTFNITVGGTWE